MRVILLAMLGCMGAADAFVVPPSAALFTSTARLPAGSKSVRASVQQTVQPTLRASAQEEGVGDLSRRSVLALIGLVPGSAWAAVSEAEVSSPKNDPYYKKLRDSQDPSSERKRLQKGMANPGASRKKIDVPKALQKGALEPPDYVFPTSIKDLEEYEQTKNGLYFQSLKKGKGTTVPNKGDIIEIHYVGSVLTTDEEGNYEVAEREGDPEIYPNLPQGIIRDSPRFDSSYDRGRTMKVRFGRAQLAGGMEEALADMHPGDAKMVFLVPELAYACPAGKVCFPDIEVDERLAFYVELVSTGKKGEGGG